MRREWAMREAASERWASRLCYYEMKDAAMPLLCRRYAYEAERCWWCWWLFVLRWAMPKTLLCWWWCRWAYKIPATMTLSATRHMPMSWWDDERCLWAAMRQIRAMMMPRWLYASARARYADYADARCAMMKSAMLDDVEDTLLREMMSCLLKERHAWAEFERDYTMLSRCYVTLTPRRCRDDMMPPRCATRCHDIRHWALFCADDDYLCAIEMPSAITPHKDMRRWHASAAKSAH